MDQMQAIRIGVVLVVVGYALYLWYQWKSPSLVQTATLLETNPSIAVTDAPAGYNYTYSLWMYVNSWSTSAKPIFARAVDTYCQIKLYLDASKPTLSLDIAKTGGVAITIPITTNFPLQRWTFVSVNVSSDVADMYLDGKLISSTILSNVLQPSATANVYVGHSMSGATASAQANDIFISNFERQSYMAGPMDVWNKYTYGNGNWWTYLGISKYNATLTIKKDGKEAAAATLF
jgi:hypothetical protein